MNADVSGLAMLTGVSVAINSVYAIQKGKNAVITVVAGAFLFLALALIGGITQRWDLARALAVVFLLASALFHGVSIASSIGTLATTAHNRPTISLAPDPTGPQGSPLNTTPPPHYFIPPGGRSKPV